MCVEGGKKIKIDKRVSTFIESTKTRNEYVIEMSSSDNNVRTRNLGLKYTVQ